MTEHEHPHLVFVHILRRQEQPIALLFLAAPLGQHLKYDGHCLLAKQAFAVSSTAHTHGFLQVWYDYGTFCLRTAKQGQAEQCLKEAVAIEPGHKAALLALAALLWHVGLHTDAAYLDQAETVLHAAKEAAADDAAVWALLSLVYESMASRRVSEHRNAAFEMRRLGKVHNRRSVAGNPYLQVSPCSLHIPTTVCL